jgi:peroxiredoxin Q/BCP
MMGMEDAVKDMAPADANGQKNTNPPILASRNSAAGPGRGWLPGNASRPLVPAGVFQFQKNQVCSGKMRPLLAARDNWNMLVAMKARPALVLTFLAAMTTSLNAEPLKVGDQAPNVTGITESGAPIQFADVYKAQTYTLVYFFPKADTKGCTAQGCSLRDAYADLAAKGVAILGVSHDGPAAQKAFKEKYHFPFTLIADPDQVVVRAFGVPDLPQAPFMHLATRQAFLIRDGKVVWADYKAKTTEQAADVLKVLASLGS